MIASSGAGCLADLQMPSNVPSAACLRPAVTALKGTLPRAGLHTGGTAGLTPPGLAPLTPQAGPGVVPGQGGEQWPHAQCIFC